MSRQLEAAGEERQAKRHDAVIRALEFEMSDVVNGSGNELKGFSVKLDEWEVLMTIRAVVDGKQQVAFVGSDDLINCILKAVRAGQRDKLAWRVDKYAE